MEDLKHIISLTKDVRLLYVEDNINARKSTLDILGEFFSDIVVGVDGADGLEKYKENQIDLVITDINMPNMDGLDMVKRIKEINNNVLILICSAHNESEYFIESIKLGVEGYLLKPIDFMQFISSLADVSEKFQAKKAQEILLQYKDVTDKSSIMSIIDKDSKITYVNSAFCEISEYDREELIGKDYSSSSNFTQEEELDAEIWKTLREKKEIWKGIVKNVSRTGKPYYLDCTVKPILDSSGEIVEYIALRHDVTAIMSPAKQLNDLIDAASVPIVVLVKIENFEDIVNFYGQKFMQEIENSFAKRLFEFMPNKSEFKKVFSMGNGEYAFAKDRALSRKTDGNIIDELLEFQESVEKANLDIDGLDYDLSVIISLAYGESALENSMYGMKNILASKENFIVANNLMSEQYDKAQSNINTLKMVKKAIQEGKIISYFQPIVNNKTGKIEKYESLVRLIDEENKVLSPYLFLNTSKKGKYYNEITSIVLDNSLEALKKTDVDISINISVLDIENERISKKIISLLKDNKEYASRIVLELLEDEDVKDFVSLKAFISEVKRLGASIAIDDFGSGYSNFVRLLEYQPDILKIDGSLVKNIVTDNLSLSLVKTVVNFAKEQKIKVIAEYVESKEIYDILCELGVDYSQGYYFGKPEPLK